MYLDYAMHIIISIESAYPMVDRDSGRSKVIKKMLGGTSYAQDHTMGPGSLRNKCGKISDRLAFLVKKLTTKFCSCESET